MENELAHWGIKGMKWGVRRTEEQLAKTAAKEASAAAKARASADPTTMSDDELKSTIARMESEQKLMKLQQAVYAVPMPEVKKSAVAPVVKKGLSEAGEKIVKSVAVHIVGTMVNKAFSAEVVEVGKSLTKEVSKTAKDTVATTAKSTDSKTT